MIRVILVDDHMIFREGTYGLLAAAKDITVVGTCGRGEEALTLIRDLLPDVVVLDIRLGDISGIEVARRLHQQGTKTKILILSAYMHEMYARNLFAVGVHGYLLKSTCGDTLIAGVRAVHGGEQVLSPEITELLASDLPHSGIVCTTGLTERELAVLRLVREGSNNKEIADTLYLGVRTVESYLSQAMAKLNARTRTEAVTLASRAGFIGDE